MAHLVDLVADVLGWDDISALEKASARSRPELYYKVMDGYRAWHVSKPPSKKDGEFVPGWFLEDTEDSSVEAMATFVSRALLYSHRVAMLDPLSVWADSEDSWPSSPQRVPEPQSLRWKSRNLLVPPDLERRLFQILFFGPLERAGLLFYAPGKRHRDPVGFDGSHALGDEERESFFRNYMAPTGRWIHVDDWGPTLGPPALARLAAEGEILGHLPGVLDLWEWQHTQADHLNLFLAERSRYRPILEWLMRRTGAIVIGQAPAEADTATLDALLTMPAPSLEAFGEFPVRFLIQAREEPVFERWRTTLQRVVSGYQVKIASGNGSHEDAADVIRALRDAQVVASRGIGQTTLFRRAPKALGKFGVSLAVGAGSAALTSEWVSAGAHTGAQVAGALIGATATGVAQGVPAATAGLKSGRAQRALEQHVKLFAQ